MTESGSETGPGGGGPDRLAILAARARSLAAKRRAILGIAGAPGAGKSTFAAALAAAIPGAAVVPMDGFHLSTARLIELGAVERRGAPDTFDAGGYLALLRRIAAGDEVRAPDFDRTAEEPVPDAIRVPVDAPLVITEGNYLLLHSPPWSEVAALLDEVWFVEVPDAIRVERLVARFVAFGWEPVPARERVTRGSDAANARLVDETRGRADLVIDPAG